MYLNYDGYENQRGPSAVYWLIGLCVAVYFVQVTLVGNVNMARWLGYAPGDIQSHSLWTVITYMFVHAGLTHLLLNMWTLWLFGPRVERAWGSSSFVWFYLWCGVGGWAFHYMFQSGGGVLVGASAAILGVAVAYASRWPHDEVLFFGVVPMKVRWLVVFMALLNIAMVVLDSGGMGGTAWAAHVGGMLAAWIYLRAPRAESLDRFRRGISPAPDYGDAPPRPVPRSGPRGARERAEPDMDDIVAQSKAAVARLRSPVAPGSAGEPAAPGPEMSQRAFDAVLDKIAARGMSSLTADERMLLEEWSRRLRGGD